MNRFFLSSLINLFFSTILSLYLEHIINQYEPDFPAGHLPNGLTDEGVDWVADTEVCQALADYYDNTDPINRPSQKNNGQFNDRS